MNQFKDGVGGPSLSPRLMLGLNILKYMDNLSDKAALKRWVDSTHYQYFCGMQYFEHDLPGDPRSLTRWRQRLGRGSDEKILRESIRIIRYNKLVSEREFDKIFVDTAVQEKNVAFPTDARLYLKVLNLPVKQAKTEKVSLRQTYEKESKLCMLDYSHKAHAMLSSLNGPKKL